MNACVCRWVLSTITLVLLFIRFTIPDVDNSLFDNYACVSGPDMVDDARDHSLIEENGIESVLPL